MSNLWKKDSSRADAEFVDLFASIGQSDAVKQWDSQVKSANWKHRFLMYSFGPKKDNTVSDGLRNDGNAYFKRGLWVEAMELYTKSLCFAEIGTDNMSLAFANRATCFLNMKEYDKCLKDIELAIGAKYPERLMPKLMKRKSDCLKMMKNHVAPKPFDPKLSFDANEQFPCMADVLEIQRNDEFGRHVVAKCDIDVGQTVIVEENFVSMVAGHDRVNCFECLQALKNFVPCEACTDVMFCSDECKRKNQIHGLCCGAAILRMPNNVTFLAKSILIAVTAFSSANELMDTVADVLSNRATQLPAAANDSKSKYATFLSLQPSKASELSIATVYKVFTGLMDIPTIKRMFDSQRSQRFLMHLIAEHFLIISNNSFGGSLASASAVGTTALVLSLLNHACAPNLFNSSGANKEVCITMRPIKKGDQLFVKYLCGDRTTRQRQDILLKQWGFLCKCDKCVPCCNQTDRKMMKSDPSFKTMQMALLYGIADYEVRESAIRCCENFLQNYGHLPWSEEMSIVLKLYTQCLLEDFPSM